MAALKFASSHNMVAFLDKPTESDGFEQIVDFLNTHPIKYALTIQALVDKKKVIITETSIRRDLQLADENVLRLLLGMNLVALWPLLSSGQDFSGRDTPLFPTMIVQAQEQRKQRKDTEDPQLSGPTEPITDETENVESVPTHSNDPLLSENTKTSQAAEITELKKKVKKLEGKRKSKPPGMKRLFQIGRSAQVVSSEDDGLVNETQGRYDDNLMFDTGVLDNEQDMAEKEVDMAEKEVDIAEKDVSTANLVTTAGEVVTTTTTIVDELTLAQTLIEIKAAKPKAVTTAVIRPKARGVIVQEPSEFTTTTSPSQPS
ncbi:hypothetical protein Tco_0431521 [Tanacetum coccineum]